MTMVSTTASSISLEGKSFWILKSAPVQTKSVFLAKIALNLLITVPFIFIDIIVAGVIIQADILIILLAILPPLVASMAFIVLGLFLNIMFPKFDYDNPIRVIKQGLPVGLNVGLSFVIIIIIFIAHIIFSSISVALALAVDTVLAGVMLLVTILLLSKIGVKKYEKINA